MFCITAYGQHAALQSYKIRRACTEKDFWQVFFAKSFQIFKNPWCSSYVLLSWAHPITFLYCIYWNRLISAKFWVIIRLLLNNVLMLIVILTWLPMSLFLFGVLFSFLFIYVLLCMSCKAHVKQSNSLLGLFIRPVHPFVFSFLVYSCILFLVFLHLSLRSIRLFPLIFGYFEMSNVNRCGWF